MNSNHTYPLSIPVPRQNLRDLGPARHASDAQPRVPRAVVAGRPEPMLADAARAARAAVLDGVVDARREFAQRRAREAPCCRAVRKDNSHRADAAAQRELYAVSLARAD